MSVFSVCFLTGYEATTLLEGAFAQVLLWRRGRDRPEGSQLHNLQADVAEVSVGAWLD